jgi:hypothetical protein
VINVKGHTNTSSRHPAHAYLVTLSCRDRRWRMISGNWLRGLILQTIPASGTSQNKSQSA